MLQYLALIHSDMQLLFCAWVICEFLIVFSLHIIAKLQLNSQLHLHSKSIQLLQELSWSYAL